MPDKDSPCSGVRKLRERHVGLWSEYHEAMTNEEAFLHGDRYQRDTGPHNRDRRRVQIRGQETQDTIRHVVGKMTAKKRSISAKPIGEAPDPKNGEIAAQLIELELGNPLKGFDREFYAALLSACETRLGVVWMDWDEDCGPFGEIIFGREDGRKFMWDPSWHPHHPKNSWLLREMRVYPEQANELYGVNWIEPDRMAFDSSGRMRSGIPLILGPNGSHISARDYDDDKATIWQCWYKNDRTKRNKGPAEKKLKPKERYMQCMSCAYKTGTQGEEGVEFPEYYAGGCEECGGGDMMRIDAHDVDVYEAAYRNGRRLVVMAPFSPAPNDDPLYNGEWTIPKARSYPALFVTRYVSPGKPMGKSDTAWMWDQQLASDNLLTKAVQSVFEHRTYWDMPSVGINDAKGKRFMFRDDQANIMFRDTRQASLGPMDIRSHNATGLDPNWGGVYMQVQAALTKHRPQLDLGPAEQNTRDIPVGSIERQVAEAEISTADFQRRVQGEMGPFAGVLYDYISATYTSERLNRLQLGGLGDMFLAVEGDDLPGFDFVIEDTPDFNGIEEARSRAAEWAVQAVTNPQTQPFFDILARIQQLPESVIKDIEERLEEMKEEAAMAPPMDVGGEIPGEPVEGESLEIEPPINLDEDLGAELPAL